MTPLAFRTYSVVAGYGGTVGGTGGGSVDGGSVDGSSALVNHHSPEECSSGWITALDDGESRFHT